MIGDDNQDLRGRLLDVRMLIVLKKSAVRGARLQLGVFESWGLALGSRRSRIRVAAFMLATSLIFEAPQYRLDRRKPSLLRRCVVFSRSKRNLRAMRGVRRKLTRVAEPVTPSASMPRFATTSASKKQVRSEEEPQLQRHRFPNRSWPKADRWTQLRPVGGVASGR